MFADDNSKFNKNGRKVSKRAKTLWEKDKLIFGQFVIFPQCFKRLVMQTRKNQGLFGKGKG